MCRKVLTISVVFVFGMIFLTQSTWPKDTDKWDDDTETNILMETWDNDLVPHLEKEWKDHKGRASFGPPVPCEQLEDLEGKWTLRVGSWDGSGRHCWADGRIKIGPGGIVEKGLYIDCDGRTKSEIIEGLGYLVVSPGCVIVGKIETSQGAFYVATGQIVGGKLILGLAQDQKDPEMQHYIERLKEDREGQVYREDIDGVLKYRKGYGKEDIPGEPKTIE
jgi:hypothetical protein